MASRLSCPVCFQGFDAQRVPKTLSPCRHTFCRHCIGQWRKLRETTCPMCRAEYDPVTGISTDKKILKLCRQNVMGSECTCKTARTHECQPCRTETTFCRRCAFLHEQETGHETRTLASFLSLDIEEPEPRPAIRVPKKVIVLVLISLFAILGGSLALFII